MSRFTKFAGTALGALGLAMTAAPGAQAATISGQMTADNYFQVFVGTGPGNYTLVASDNDGNQWNQLRSIRFDIPDHVLADCNCRIAVAVWGDGAVAEGLYGNLSWNGNQVGTGSAFHVRNTGMPGPLNASQIDSSETDQPASANSYNWPGLPSSGAQGWIWDGSGRGGGGDNRVRIFSVKCSDVVSQSGGGAQPVGVYNPPAAVRGAQPRVVPTYRAVPAQRVQPNGTTIYQPARTR